MNNHNQGGYVPSPNPYDLPLSIILEKVLEFKRAQLQAAKNQVEQLTREINQLEHKDE